MAPSTSVTLVHSNGTTEVLQALADDTASRAMSPVEFQIRKEPPMPRLINPFVGMLAALFSGEQVSGRLFRSNGGSSSRWMGGGSRKKSAKRRGKAYARNRSH